MSQLPVITPELLHRYNRPGPRYTSYPTVPAWAEGFTAADYVQALEQVAQQPDAPLALYVHLPFCVERCHYCGCNATVTRHAHVVDTYLDRLEQEVELVLAHVGHGRRVVEMHWGGGTPNFLDNEQTCRLHGFLARHFAFDPRAELSVEVDPRIASPEQFAVYHALGFQRVSLGVQDFDPAVQQAIGRIQPEEQTYASYAACRELGFESINLDLVYGLPEQNEATFRRTLERIIALAPDRIATFAYAHVPWVRTNQKYVDVTHLPDAPTRMRLLHMAIELLEAAGYIWIGLDHFALPDDDLAIALQERRLHRNFMGYTARRIPHVLAFGMSAIGDLADTYVQNDAKLGSYQKAVDAGQLPVVRGHRLTTDDRLRRLAINHLMCNLELPESLSLPEFGATLSDLLPDPMAQMDTFIEEGWLSVEDERLQVTTLGRFFLRNIAMAFDAYFDPAESKPLFSRTV